MLCFVGPSGIGKTTVVSKVIAQLSEAGVRVGALKHASHHFEMDTPGKDTYRFRQSGAHAIAIASKSERALITTTPRPATLAELAATLPDGLEVILVEGYKSEGAPKIEVHRGDGPLLTGLEGLIAVVTDNPTVAADAGVPVLALDDVDGQCAFVREFAGLPDRPPTARPRRHR